MYYHQNDKGDIAVLVSPKFGAGWYSWNPNYPECLFNPAIVKLVLEGNRQAAGALAEMTYTSRGNGYFCKIGALDLVVHWVRPGTVFRIDEYDGRETLVVKDDGEEWIVAGMNLPATPDNPSASPFRHIKKRG